MANSEESHGDIDGAVVAVASPWMRPGGANPNETASSLDVVLSEFETSFERLVARYGTNACRLGAASVWSKGLFAALLPAPTLAALAGDDPPMTPVLAIADESPVAMVAPQPAAFSSAPRFDRFADYVELVLRPAVARLATASGLAPRLYWSNAATMLAYLREQWSLIPASEHHAETLRQQILDAERLPGAATRNPFVDHIRYVPSAAPGCENGARQRRVCCLRDRLGRRLCASCPKIGTAERDLLLARSAG